MIPQPPSFKNDPATGIIFPVNPAFHKFCWHLRVGMLREVETDRIHAYARFFDHQYLQPHLRKQQELIESAGLETATVKKALAHYRKLRRLFGDGSPTVKTFGRLEDSVEQFGRFEQKQLLVELQNVRCECTLRRKEVLPFYDHELARKLLNWHDRFWEIQ